MSMWWILGIVVIVFVLMRYLKVTVKTSPQPSAAVTPVARPALAEITGDTDGYDLVGESNYQRELVALFGPKGERGIDTRCAAVLVREPENPYGKNAVRCEINGAKVGYLSRDDAKDFGKHMRKQSLASMPVVANVRGGWKNAENEGNYGVVIEVQAGLIE